MRASTPVRNDDLMIDYFALALGHGLMAIALLRLFFRDALDHDPLLDQIKQATRERRMKANSARQNARRQDPNERAARPGMQDS